MTYTCPMHPEVRQDGPGSCPKCGMSLEPLVPRAAGAAAGDGDGDGAHGGDGGGHDELADMRRRFRISAVLTLPVFALGMGDMLPGRPLDGLASPRALLLAELLLASPVVLWGGWPFFVRGWARRGRALVAHPDADTAVACSRRGSWHRQECRARNRRVAPARRLAGPARRLAAHYAVVAPARRSDGRILAASPDRDRQRPPA
jgi:hypothetical protein